MPSPLAVPIIQAGAQLLGQGVNAYAQGKMNRKQRKWSEKMYGWQRKDALTDWLMQNEYNKPVNQMQRLKEAGLNPMLVYGNGADVQAGPMRSADSPSWNPQAPQFDMGEATAPLMGIYNVKMMEEQMKNMEAQRDIMYQDKLLRAAQIIDTIHAAGLKGVDLKYADRLKTASLTQAQETINQTRVNTQVTLDRNEREAAMNSSNIKEAAERILTMRMQRSKIPLEKKMLQAQINNLDKDVELKEFERQLNEQGVTKGDALWIRMLQQYLGKGIINLDPVSGSSLKGSRIPGMPSLWDIIK